MFIKWIAAAVLATLFAAAYYMPKQYGEAPLAAAPKTSLPADPGNPVELGDVHWNRSLTKGISDAQSQGKPILILFQEVPGCGNCTRYGNTALRHPLIVEAIESFFVPVCIYNNKGGEDAKALQRFNEPSWNNPVVRIIRADGSDIVPRMAEFGSLHQLVSGMRQALEQVGITVPQYLLLLESELKARETGLSTATFSMYCFWSGESAFGSIPGVVETEPGFQNGQEVVRVQYDPSQISASELEKVTAPKGIKSCQNGSSFRTDREPKYYLAQTPFRAVPMTSLQACRANSLVALGESPNAVLSPRQRAIADYIERNPEKSWKNHIGTTDLVSAWTTVRQIMP